MSPFAPLRRHSSRLRAPLRVERGTFSGVTANSRPTNSAAFGVDWETGNSVSNQGSYVYRVKAVSPSGVSQWSGCARADTPAAPEPEPASEPDPALLAPSNLIAAIVDDGVSLSWDGPAQDAESVTGYELARGVAPQVGVTVHHPYPESTDRSLTGRAAGLPESSAGASAFAGRCRSEEPSLSVAQRGSGALRAPARGCARRARACWREPRSRAGAVSGRQAGSGSARNRASAAAHWPAQGQRFARCRVQRRAEWVSRPARAK